MCLHEEVEGSRDTSLASPTVVDTGVRTVIRLVGELDAADAAALTCQLAAAGADGDLVLDCAAVLFVDTTVLTVLAKTVRSRRRSGQPTWLVDPPRHLRRLAALCGLQAELLDPAVPRARSCDLES